MFNFGSSNTFQFTNTNESANPFGGSANPFGSNESADPFGSNKTANPFRSNESENPFGGSANPFGNGNRIGAPQPEFNFGGNSNTSNPFRFNFERDSDSSLFSRRNKNLNSNSSNFSTSSIPDCQSWFNFGSNPKKENLNQWKSMCTEETMNWREEEITQITNLQIKIDQNIHSNESKIKQEFPQNKFTSWNEVQEFLDKKHQQISSKIEKGQDQKDTIIKNIQTIESDLIDIEQQIQELQQRKQIHENLLSVKKNSLASFDKNIQTMEVNQYDLFEMCTKVAAFCENENELNAEIKELFKQKKFKEFECTDIYKLLWKMDLIKYQKVFEANQINGEVAAMMNELMFQKMGLSTRDCLFVVFNFKLMQTPGYYLTLSSDYEEDCCVCSHDTPEKTIHLLKEYEIPIDDDFILDNNYCAPILTFFTKALPNLDIRSPNGRQIITQLTKWKKIHKSHLKDIKKMYKNSQEETKNMNL